MLSERGEKDVAEDALLLRDITKSFPGVLANDQITLRVKTGEIHALLGENGAGKTTLMNIVYGIHHPDEGEILVFGKEARIRSPKDAIELGIGMVHQHFMLVDRLNAVENIILGNEPCRWPLLKVQEAKAAVERLLSQYGFRIDLNSEVWKLPVGMQQRIEIVKCLFREARIMILDEPTAVLTPQETEELFSILRKLASRGLSIVFISHKLEEAKSLCDRITVLRDGRLVSTIDAKGTSKTEIAQMMVGKEILFGTSRPDHAIGDVLIEVDGITADGRRGLQALKGVSFKIHRGEIFGIAGVDGNGQAELAEVVSGLRRPATGVVKLDGVDMAQLSRERKGRTGIGYIPEDRHRRGLVLSFPLWENLILKTAATRQFSYFGLYFNFRKIRRVAKEMTHFFDIRAPSAQAPVRNYSGGNQQKIVLAREFGLKPAFLVAGQPTRGLDVSAIEFVHGQLIEFVKQGNAVLLISTDLEEVLSLSHRFAVIFEGELVGIMENQGDAELKDIGLMMAGSRRVMPDTAPNW